MSFDRRSFHVGILAGIFLLAGLVLGIVMTLRWDGVSSATSAQNYNGQLPLSIDQNNKNYVQLVKAVMPAVVNISTSRTIKQRDVPSPFMEDPFFRQFFGDEFFRRFEMPRERREASLGSGVIVGSDGYIITNNHVIAKADEIKVLLHDKREFTGKVIGTDPKSDIAVIKINAKNLPTLPWGDSDQLEVGEIVLAIGNPFGLNQTVTMGIVSAVGRANVGIADYEDFIQTDAAINPGNSGGALVNVRGELVGINTAIFSRSGGYMGIGFAVPSNMTQAVMNSLVKSGKVVRGWLGVSIQDINQELAKQFGVKNTDGALVSEIVPDSPASQAKLMSGDIITKFDGKVIENTSTLRNIVAATPIGKTVQLEVLRDKKTVTISVKITEQPKDIAEAGTEGSVTGEGKDNALAGLEVRNLTPEIARQLGLSDPTVGVVITELDPSSAAAEADLNRGDVILEINRMRIKTVQDFKKASASLGKKDSALLFINRRGNKVFVVIKP
jgi:serine protease Do